MRLRALLLLCVLAPAAEPRQGLGDSRQCAEPLTSTLPARHLFAFAKPGDEPGNSSAWESRDWARIVL